MGNTSGLPYGTQRGCSAGRGEGHGLTGGSDSRTATHRGRTPRSLIKDECSARPIQASEEAGSQRLGRGEGYIEKMRKIQIIGLAFAAVFAFSMVSASGASAFTLWDECMATTNGTFNSADCNVAGSPKEWEFLEITTLTATDSLPANITLINLGLLTVKILCEGSVDGSVGLNGEDQVTEILNLAGEPITSTKPVTCTNIENCSGTITAYPVNLPWSTQLVNAAGEDAEGNLLGPHTGGENPGWHAACGSTTNQCTNADTILLVENLEAELEVDLTFPVESETSHLPLASCTNTFEKEGLVEGTVSILLAGVERALRAM